MYVLSLRPCSSATLLPNGVKANLSPEDGAIIWMGSCPPPNLPPSLPAPSLPPCPLPAPAPLPSPAHGPPGLPIRPI